MTKKTTKKTSKKKTTKRKTKRTTKKATKKKAVKKQPKTKVNKLKAEDIKPIPHIIRTGEVDEETGLERVIFKGKYTKEEQELLAPKAASRSLKDLAQKAKKQREDDETRVWLEEQADELTNGKGEKFNLNPQDILEEFDKTLTRGMFDRDSLDAMTTHGTIECLEKMYGEAQAELLKAQRKSMVLEMIVKKAHDLLSEQALTFLTK